MTAIAIKEWDIQRGCKTVERIDLPFLLHRIADSAHQDAIRLAAAIRLDDATLIRTVAGSAKDILLRWRGARHLNDPLIMTDVALFKQTDDRFEEIRTRAHKALMKHLDELQWKGRSDELVAYIFAIDHTPYKLEAFVRLPATKIQPSILRHMTSQDYRYTPEAMLKHFFIKIQSSGWHALQTHHTGRCNYCRGYGQLMLSNAATDGSAATSDSLPCPECRASGKVSYRKVICSHSTHAPIVFRLLEDQP